jgi:hypothetical protein
VDSLATHLGKGKCVWAASELISRASGGRKGDSLCGAYIIHRYNIHECVPDLVG